MCGIIGTWNYKKFPNFVKDNLKNLRDRGPDMANEQVLANISFGHTRLSIQDLSPNGLQPMFWGEGENTEVILTYNGELWNKEEIISVIEKKTGKSYQPKSTSDTEVILHFYLECCRKEPENLKMLNGMIALAIFDTIYQNQIMFRDCVGEKPLYFTADGRFCSKQSILSDTLKYDSEQVTNTLVLGYSSAIYEDVMSLEPGEMYLNGNIKRIQDIEYSMIKKTFDHFEDQLEESIKRKTANMDVPFALCLSGGLDSSLLVAKIRRLKPGLKLETITIGFDPNDDDVINSRIIAEKYKTNHHELFIDKEDLIKRIPDLVNHIDSPMELGSMLPTFVIAETIKNKLPHIKVVILGEGADEMFFGYKRHMEFCKGLNKESYYRRVAKFNIGLSERELDLEDIRKFDMNHELVDYHMKRIDMIFSGFGIEARCPFLYKGLMECAVNSYPSQNITPDRNKIWIRDSLVKEGVPTKIFTQKKRPLKLFQNMDEVRMKILLEFNKRCENAQRKKN